MKKMHNGQDTRFVQRRPKESPSEVIEKIAIDQLESDVRGSPFRKRFSNHPGVSVSPHRPIGITLILAVPYS